MKKIYTSVANWLIHFIPLVYQKKRYYPLFVGILFCSFLLSSNQADASHFRYGNVNYRIVSNTATTTLVEFTITMSYYYGPGSQFTQFGSVPIGGTINTADNFNFGNGSVSNLSYIVTSKNNTENWLVASRTLQRTYTSLSDFTAILTGIARVGSLQPPNSSTNLQYIIRTIVALTNPSNQPPSASTPPIFYVPVNQAAFNIQINASDPEGFPLAYAWAPGGATGSGLNSQVLTINGPATLNASTGQITLNTQGTAVGNQYAAQVWIRDNLGARVAVDFIVQTVTQSNPPVFDYASGFTPANGSVIKFQPGQTVNFNVKASDMDAGSSVTLSAIGVPVGSTLSPSNNVGNPILQNFNWVTSMANLGSRTITFSAVDNFFSQTTTSVTIVVTLAPVFDVPPTPATGTHIVAAPGTPISFMVQAQDPDPNDICRIIEINGKDMSGKIPIYAGATTTPGLPTTAGNTTSLQFNWTPVASQWGHRHVIFTAEDGYNDKTDHEIPILVNTVPNFTSTPVTDVFTNKLYSYDITVYDPDVLQGDVIQILGQAIPAWLTLTDNGDGTATLSGTPALGDAGLVNIKLIAEDLYHHESPVPTQEFAITVIPCDFSISGTLSDVSCFGGSDGSIDLTLNGVYGTPSFTWTGPDNFSASTEDLTGLAAGTYNVLVTSDLGCSETTSFEVGTIPDVAPPDIFCPDNMNVNNDPGDCGAVVNFSVSASDNCPGVTVVSSPASGSVFQIGTTNVTSVATDAAGNTATCSFTVTVNNTLPVINSVTGPVTPTALGNSITIEVQHNNDNNLTKATIDWDDQTAVQNISNPASGSFNVTHTYATPGVYTVSVTLTDACGAVSETFNYQYIVIYDPSGGFVTGGGWFWSEACAIKDGSGATGKANFGFVAKYKKGSTVPDGNTEFQFKAGAINFHSTAYEDMRLVISGARANYKGVGSIQGSNHVFGFLVSAIDGQVSGGGGIDKFRIKIWDKDDGNRVIYDNNCTETDENADPATAIGGGSIVIHSTKTKSAEIETAIEPEPVFSGLKAYPNPFHEKLYFEFSKEKDSKATLILFDGTGREIEVLFNQQIKANQNYRIEYVPNNVATNMVFYRMTYDNEVINGKLIYRK